MTFWTPRRILTILAPLYVAIAFGLSACQLLFFLPELKDGKHYTQPITDTEIARGQSVAACLQAWARQNGYTTADYSDVDFHDLVIVGVGDPGVAGPHDFVAARESGDTMFIDLRIVNENGAEYVALQRHEAVHIVQQHHAELIGASNSIHWAPPWDYCHVVRYLIA